MSEFEFDDEDFDEDGIVDYDDDDGMDGDHDTAMKITDTTGGTNMIFADLETGKRFRLAMDGPSSNWVYKKVPVYRAGRKTPLYMALCVVCPATESCVDHVYDIDQGYEVIPERDYRRLPDLWRNRISDEI